MMLDEIQTGMGRTGKWFAWQHSNARPDVATLAKALGNGVPVGACLARSRAADMMQPGSHGTTFGGNPLACRAAIAVLESLEQEQCVARLGEHMLAGFSRALAGLDGVIDIRGRGLMIGIELDRPCSELVSKAIEQGLLINVTAERVVRLLPPLILTEKQADMIVEQVSNLIHEFIGQ
jgi:acetylornithine aminotransferase